MPKPTRNGIGERFWVKRLGDSVGPDQPGDAFAVYSASFDAFGGHKDSVIINIFIGSDRSEAVRYCNSLNAAVESFHNRTCVIPT